VRTIRYVLADDNGNFSNYHGWGTFQYEGRSVVVLRMALAELLGNELDVSNIRMCTRAGRYGRLTPMIISLPRSHDPIEVIALAMGTPGENFDVFPLLCAINMHLLYICFYSDENACSVDAKNGLEINHINLDITDSFYSFLVVYIFLEVSVQWTLLLTLAIKEVEL
jgi:hypothetical protein